MGNITTVLIIFSIRIKFNFFEQKVDLLYSLAIQAKAQIAIANNNEANYLPYSLSLGTALVFK